MNQVPFQPEWAIAVTGRGLQFMAEMPEIIATCDDGDVAGRVVVLGPGRTIEGQRTVRTRIYGASDIYDVPAEWLTVDGATAEHLALALSWIERARTRPIISGGGCRAANFYRGGQW